jgi:glutaredoxin
MKLILYGTDFCQLCDEALEVVEQTLEGRSYQLEVVDISTSNELMAKYAYTIPVLRLENAELGWPFSGSDILSFVAVNT